MATGSGATSIARFHMLKTGDDDTVARIEPARDDAEIIRHRSKLDLAIGGLVVLADDHDVLLVLVGSDGTLGDRENRSRARLRQAYANELTMNETPIGIVESRTETHCTARHVDLVIDQLQNAAAPRAFVRRRRHLDGDLFDVRRRVSLRGQRSKRACDDIFICVEARIDRD